LFLPVPLVLLLFTRAPLGILVSLGLGVLLMLTHRLYARPWALARSRSRCLWCGRTLDASRHEAREHELADPLGRATWRTCREAHARALTAVLAWAAARSGALKLGILGSLGVFLAWAAAAALGLPSGARFADAVAFFRLGVAASVLPLGWLAPYASSAAQQRSPFPLHVPALIGLLSVVWLFRLIGLLWLVQGALHLAERALLL
jgi:hypothetical protein